MNLTSLIDNVAVHINDIATLVDSINVLVEDFFDKNATKMSSTDVSSRSSLDPRSFRSSIYVSENFVAVRAEHVNAFDYYGGFEYVDSDDKTNLGDYVIYFAESSRVQSLLDELLDNVDDDSENGDE